MPQSSKSSPDKVEAKPAEDGESPPESRSVKHTHYLVGDPSVPRRGPKGHFQGSRKEFLENHVTAYLAAGKGNCQNFWHDLFSAWWKQYPWRLADNEEPPMENPEEMAKLALAGPNDSAQKKLVVNALEGVQFSLFLQRTETDRAAFQRLKTWFTNCTSAATNGTHRDTLHWFPLLQ